MAFRPPLYTTIDPDILDQFLHLLSLCPNATICRSTNNYFMLATTEIEGMEGTVMGINRPDQQLFLHSVNEQDNVPRHANYNNDRAPDAMQHKNQQESHDRDARITITVSHTFPGTNSGGNVDTVDRTTASRGVSHCGPRSQGVIGNVRICDSPHGASIIHYEQDTHPGLGNGLCIVAVLVLAFLFIYGVCSK
ncbi:hypothetical protein GGR51DRAFT_559781 [Nemania sp. FL0031]|nr:hypothetical protein GGR51DRAFT_559781 [Nemania sp. FL0031]